LPSRAPPSNAALALASLRPILIPVLLFVCATSGCELDQKERFDPTLQQLVSNELWKASNRGRIPLGAGGYFSFPDHVRSVIVDVGAHKLERTKRYLRRDPDVSIVAIEPLWEPWESWPDEPRVIGVPVAISLERKMLEFNVNSNEDTSSLLDTIPGNKFEVTMKTVEVRQVPGVRLEDVLERIPPDLPIVFLKTDIQGMDLAALKSASEHLRRVKRVQTEIINLELYEKDRPEAMGTEQEFHDYMKSMGFSLVREVPTPERWWVDAFYENDHWDGLDAGQ
jgi:FkbM family methyltransferase